ncbi:Sel1 domain protein repeat-containing protein [Methylorubrum populi BJ001]|jgi:TPR repeat protein|uniref:Sel1 domain protein repeat-containing protein n=1 Tax=Methylorubrum populi (strain ATCC BAA-705 / NCIMB 13946 / BJ001) TaxID=441620 RepID=B1Z983_METPB|nr:tetratricopeptide repeat protein [Methylorubrum populi]ACB80489.1 Sel1 domain protein repeat-containing protein [Methylorubrum populi BJ001]
MTFLVHRHVTAILETLSPQRGEGKACAFEGRAVGRARAVSLAALSACAILALDVGGLRAAPKQPTAKEPPAPATAKPNQLDLKRELPSPYSANAEGARPATANPNADAAYGAYQRGRYVTAFREATKRIEANPKDAAAMTLLGELYNQGLGVKQDPKRAHEWYRLAAAQNDANAMASLGLMAMDGRGQPKDEKAGRAWLEQAARKGQPSASYNLALIQLAGSKPEDLAAAVANFRTAAEAEVPAAQYALGVLYLQGKGVPRDTTQAAQWFRRAADNGDLGAEVEFAIRLFNGDGVPKDEARAARYFLHAAQRGNAIAQNRIAKLYVAGRGVSKNLVEAAAWNLAAASQGRADAGLDQATAGLNPDERRRAEALAADRANLSQ